MAKTHVDYRSPMRNYLRDFRYKVIRLKYFILVVAALILEITTLIIYLLKSEEFLDFDLFSASVLYGTTSTIIVILAIGCLVLIKLDKKRDKDQVKLLQDFKRKYYGLLNKFSDEINDNLKGFDSETRDIETKINYAITLSEKYGRFLKEFEELEVPKFLNDAFKYESDHLRMEKQFYEDFSSFSNRSELEKITRNSDAAHRNFLNELNLLEKSLNLIV